LRVSSGNNDGTENYRVLKSVLKYLGYGLLALASFVGLILCAAAIFFLTIPRPNDIRDCITTKMYHVHLCAKDPTYVKLRDISKNARTAFIVSEDGAFYSHHGFDWDEMKLSFEKNLEKHEYARGGSTITQQLAKNVYLSSEKSVFRKIKEAVITIELEKQLSKDEILEKYLNVVEFDNGLYGIGPASRHYFGKSAAQLSPAEGAFLAFLLPNPKKYSVSFRNKQLTPFARHQTREIVDRLLRFNKISPEEHAAAIAQVDTLFGGSAPAELSGADSGVDQNEQIEPSAEEAGPPPENDGDADGNAGDGAAQNPVDIVL
jgi:monofunctional biosynthetic peptidoglycan transglycosylase